MKVKQQLRFESVNKLFANSATTRLYIKIKNHVKLQFSHILSISLIFQYYIVQNTIFHVACCNHQCIIYSYLRWHEKKEVSKHMLVSLAFYHKRKRESSTNCSAYLLRINWWKFLRLLVIALELVFYLYIY